MKKLISLFLLIALVPAFGYKTANAQCSVGTATCFGNFVVTDNNPGTYYLIYLRVVTDCPTTSTWTPLGTIYPGDLNTSFPFDNKNASPVGFPEAYDDDFFTITIRADKYVGTPGTFSSSQYGSSYATRTGAYGLVAVDDPIRVAF